MVLWDILSFFASVALIDRAVGSNPLRIGIITPEDTEEFIASNPIPPEQICRRGKYILYKNVLKTPTGVVKLAFSKDNLQNPPVLLTSTKCQIDYSLNEVDLVPNSDFGIECYGDGLRFWYTELDRTVPTRYTNVHIIGTTYRSDVERNGIAYALVTPGLIDLLGNQSSLEDNECVEVTEATSKCYRVTGQKCDRVSSRCIMNDDWDYECQCYSGFHKGSFNAPCIDIDECQLQDCEDADTTCVNVPGSFRCDKIITSPPPSCANDELDLRTRVCTPKRVINPPELSCAINGTTAMKFFFPVGEQPVMADADVRVDIVSKQTVNNKDRWTEQTLSLTCYSEPFTKMGSALLDNLHAYGVTSEVDIPEDLAYHIIQLQHTEAVGGVNAECHSNGVLVWSIGGAQIYFIKVTSDNLIPGNINTTLKYSLTGDPRTVSPFTCKKFGAAEDCYWASSQHECGANKICNVTAKADDHFSVGCVCKPGFVGEEGGDAPCSNTTLCIPGLKVERHKCVDVDECADDTADCVEGDDCKNLLGGYECKDREDCPYGTEYNNNNTSCEDIDECALQTDTCDPGTTNCVNIREGFKCECKNPKLQLGSSFTACVEPQYEFRLLDYNKFRCCSHRDGAAYLVRGRKGGLHNGYSEITPVACVGVTDIDLSHVRWAYTKPYILSETGDHLEVEHLLLLVDTVRERKREPEAIAELLYPNGCRRAFSLGSVHNASHTPHRYYISYTPPSRNYFHPGDSSFSKCRRSLRTNVEWLSQHLHTPEPATMFNVSCDLPNSGGGRVIIIPLLLVPTTFVLALFLDVIWSPH